MSKRNGEKRRAQQRAKALAKRCETGAAVSRHPDLEAAKLAAVEAELAAITPREWLIVQTWSNSETMVEEELGKLGISAYVPREIVKGNVRCRRELVNGVPRPKAVKIKRPLFYGYVFACLGEGRRLDQLFGVLGVAGVLRKASSEQPALARPRWVEELQLFEQHGLFDRTGADDRALKPGDLVRITGGKFTGSVAQVLRANPGDKRIRVMLELFGRASPLDNVKVDHVELVQAA